MTNLIAIVVLLLCSWPASGLSLHRHKKPKADPQLPLMMTDPMAALQQQENINAYLDKKVSELNDAKDVRPDLLDSHIKPALDLIEKIRNTEPGDPSIPDMLDDLHSRMVFILDSETLDVT